MPCCGISLGSLSFEVRARHNENADDSRQKNHKNQNKNQIDVHDLSLKNAMNESNKGRNSGSNSKK